MITIVKGPTTLKVSRGAFRNFYAALGFVELSHPETHETVDVVNDPPDTPDGACGDSPQQSSDENCVDDLEAETDEEKFDTPLSEMSFTQLCAYAEHLNIEYEGIRSKKELRDLIRQHL